ncbi:LuxR C-terminal-related transcriptional regulator [Dactylosporangium sp. NPDC049525]|uniref:response regulator transcription factor n=1 Tax=Dactylosporangium sp. NPDC049525 TaxID=3154730 RepID=UPI00341C0E07
MTDAHQLSAFEPGCAMPLMTNCELEVLRHLATRTPTGQIAAAMHLTAHAVRAHVRVILRTLEVSRRGDAVRRARAAGLL